MRYLSPPVSIIGIFVFLMLAQQILAQDLNVSNGAPFNDIDFLLNNVFTNDDCITIENMTFNGTPSQIGFFNNGASTITAGAGIVIATSNITAALGPNNDGGFSQFATGQGDEPDLEDLLPGNSGLFDIAVLEFDFTPDENNISFNYVFASDEYPEFVCTEFNDVFGFFLSGPGINGPFENNAENIATLPNGDEVAINSVNNGTVGTVFQANQNLCSSLSNDEFYVENNNGQLNIQYDGFTTVLTASADVVPCETYHIKIAIADLGDPAWDSAVFLEAESFGNGSAGFTNSIGTNGPVMSDDAIEGCVDGFILFQRSPGSPNTDDFVIELDVSGTATAGIDYTPSIPSMVTIPAGQSSVQIDIVATDDGFGEGLETIEVEVLTVNCVCDLPESIVINIVEEEKPELLPIDDICSSEVSFLVLDDFLLAPFAGEWSGPGVTSGVLDATSVSGMIDLSFTADFPCHDPLVASIVVQDPQTPVLGDIADICLLTASVIDLSTIEDPVLAGVWSGDGVTGNEFDPSGLTGTIELTYTPTDDCTIPETTEVNLVDVLVPAIDPFDPICENEGPLDLNDFGDTDVPGVWSGDGVSGGEFDPTGLLDDIELIYTPDDACGEVVTEMITVLPVVDADLMNVPELCETDGLLDLSDFESPGVSGDWEIDGSNGSVIDPTDGAGTLSVMFTPDAPCSEPVEFDVVVNEVAEADLEDAPMLCEGSTDLIDLTSLEEAGVDGIWSGDGVSGNDFDPDGLNGTIELTFTPDGDCVDPATLEIEFIQSVDFSIGDLPLVCADGAADVDLDDLLSQSLDGTWSGPGVVSNIWNASGLDGDITLTFSPDDDCADAEEVSTTILLAPTIVLGAPNCISASEYEVELSVDGEANAVYSISSDAPAGTLSDEINEGETLVLVFSNDEVMYSIDVTQQDADNCIDSADITTPICDCPTADPIAELIESCGIPTTIDFDDYTLSNLVNEDYLNTDDDNMDGIDWFDNQMPDVGDDTVDLASFLWSEDDCEPATSVLYPFLRCDLLQDGFDGSSDDVYVAIGMLEVVIYPDLSNLEIEIDDSNDCCPIVTSFECDGFSFYSITNSFDNNGASPDCTSETGVGQIEFTVVNESLPASISNDDCASVSATVGYSCLNCPNVVNEASGLQVFCDTDDADLSDAATGLEVESAITPTEAFVSWHIENDSDSDIYTPGSFASSDLCLSETFEIFAFLNCDLLGDGFDGSADDSSIAAGSIEIEVYPDLANLIIEIEDEGECCPFVSSWDCSDQVIFEISNDYDGGAENPDCTNELLSGNIIFTVTQTDIPTDLQGTSCESISANTTFNCTVCPDVAQPATGVQYFCGEISADLSDATTGLMIGSPVGSTILNVNWYLDDGPMPSVPFVPGTLSVAMGCDPLPTTIFAFLECDVNGDGFNGGPDDNFIAAGFVEVVSYPDLSDLEIEIDDNNECCPIVSSWDCMGNANYSISNDYDLNGATPDCSAEDGSGSITFVVEHENLPAEIVDQACISQAATTDFNCSECPSVTPVSDLIKYCGGGFIDPDNLISPELTAVAPGTIEVAYFLDNGSVPNQALVPGLVSANDCEVFEQSIFVYVLCDLNGDGFSDQADDNYIFAGEIVVQAFPVPSEPFLVQESECIYTIETECPNDNIDFSGSIEVALGDEASELEVVVSSADPTSNCTNLLNIIEIPGCPEIIEVDVVLPTGFSPNSDGFNDLFKPIVKNISNYELHVFDRWGNQVYESFVEIADLGEAPNEGWDGTYQNEDCPIGVFAVYLIARDIEGEEIGVQGNVTLIR